MKKTIAAVLCLVMMLAALPQAVFAADSVDLGAVVKREYEAYSSSANVSRGSFYGPMAMLSHAVTGRGKDLNVGEGHAVTAILLNSEAYTAGIVAALTKFVESGEDSIYLTGSQNFYQSNFKYSYKANGKSYVSGAPTGTNDYDSALCAVAGGVKSYLTVTKTASTADEITYRVEILLQDGFDFDGNYDNWEEAGLEKTLTAIGKLLTAGKIITPYNWSVLHL